MPHGHPQTAPAAIRRDPGNGRLCVNCPAPVTGSQPGKLFCTPACQRDFHKRWRDRGRQLAPFAVADRLTRGGSTGDTETGKTARAVMQRLIARFTAEDKAAGRMPMPAYVRRLARHHDLPL